MSTPPSRALEKALRLAELGYSVLPVVDKRPVLAGGYKSASRDRETIRRMFAAEPGAEVAVCPGACEPPLVALDVDRKHGVDGLTTLLGVDEDMALRAEAAAAQRTPSGGLHLLFRAAGPTRSTVGAIGPGLDTRGDNGYIVIYADDLPPAEAAPPAPEWLTTAARRKPETQPATPAEPAGPEAIAAARAYLARAPIAVQGRGGNNTAYRVACQLVNLGLTAEQAVELMLDTWNPRCMPPWAGAELPDLIKTVASAARNSQDGPRRDGLTTLGEALSKAKRRQEEEPKSRWRVLYGNQFADRPPPRWLVPELVQADSLALVVGKYGSFKSFVALDLACSLASGQPVLGRVAWTPEESRLKVLYCAGEGVSDLAVRYRAYVKHRGLPDIPDMGFVEDVPRIAAMLTDPAASAEFRKVVDDHDVLVIDTLARATVGMDENDNALMSAAVDWLDKLRQERPADRPLTVIVVHHTGKSGEEPRGASALPAAADAILRVEKLGTGLGALHAAKFKASAGWDEPIRLMAETVDLDDTSSIVLRAVSSGIAASAASKRLQAADDNLVAAALAALDATGTIPEDELPSILVQSLTEFDGEPADPEWMLPGHPVLRRVACALRRLLSAAPEHNGLRLLPGGVYYANGAYAKNAPPWEDSS